MHPKISFTSEIENLIRTRPNEVVISFSVSGGKDSDSLVTEVNEALDEMNFTGERILIHSDLGEEIEHADSLPQCRRLSEHVNIPLIVVKPKRDMLTRWEYRWECNSERFINLNTVKIATWASSAEWRFCTSEEKTAPICRTLKKLYPGKIILNAVGLRGEESTKRAKEPIAKANKLLQMKRDGTSGLTWLPIRDFSIEDVFLSHRRHNFGLHEAYQKNGNSRVSCVYCVLAGEGDLRASLRDERTHRAYRRISELEALTTFSFQPGKWLSDLAPELLSETTREALRNAKERAIRRQSAESLIPKELLFDKSTGFPSFQPDLEQCKKLGAARRGIGAALNLEMNYTSDVDIYHRYAELLVEKRIKEEEKMKEEKRKKEKKSKSSQKGKTAVRGVKPTGQLALFA